MKTASFVLPGLRISREHIALIAEGELLAEDPNMVESVGAEAGWIIGGLGVEGVDDELIGIMTDNDGGNVAA